jgi:superfamily II DNA or RNA helicase
MNYSDWNTKKLGVKYYKLIGQRKKLLYNADNKLQRTYNYIIKNPDKTVIVFSQSQESIDTLQEMLGDIAITIHSGLKDKQRTANLKKFKDKRTKVRVILSVKALNEGLNVEHLDVGICLAGTSSKKDGIQMLGRILRLYKDKHALFFNLYIKNTQDQVWLRNRTYALDKRKIKWNA